MYHSRRPQPLIPASEPVRLTCPRSAANTPIWQVKELATSTVVLTMANGMFSIAVSVCHSGSVPFGAAWALVTLRIVKYAANRAAKNISSEASHTMVPTATMSGRPSRPRSRDWGMRVQRAVRLDHRAADLVCMKSHGVIIAVPNAQVTTGHANDAVGGLPGASRTPSPAAPAMGGRAAGGVTGDRAYGRRRPFRYDPLAPGGGAHGREDRRDEHTDPTPCRTHAGADHPALRLGPHRAGERPLRPGTQGGGRPAARPGARGGHPARRADRDGRRRDRPRHPGRRSRARRAWACVAS